MIFFKRILRLELCIRNGMLLIRKDLNAYFQEGSCIYISISKNIIIGNDHQK